MSLPTEDQIREVLKSVIDPEIHMDILNLGLIYGVERDEEKSHIHLRMTLTSPACPYGPEIQRQTHMVLSALPGVKSVEIEITFSPPWDPNTMATDEAKDILGIF